MLVFRALLVSSLLTALISCSTPAPPPAAPAPPPPSTSAEFLTAIRAAIAADDLSPALALAEQGHQRFPDQLEIALEQAKLLLLLDRRTDAMTLLETLPKDDPNVLESYGYAELVYGDIEKARPLLQRAIDLTAATPTHPAAATCRYRMGLLLLRNGENAAALASFQAAEKVNTRLTDAIYHAMGAAERLGDQPAAAVARGEFGRLYEERLIQQNAFVEGGYDPRRPIDRGENLEWRPAVTETTFEREFPAGDGIEFACRVPKGNDAFFRVSIKAGPGAGQTLLSGVHRAAPNLPTPWFPYSFELPPGMPGQKTTVLFEVQHGSRWARLLGRAPIAGAAFSEPGALHRPAADTANTQPNVLLISLDTLRADKLGCYGGRAGITPEIDRLAAEGVRFARAESASNWTLPAHYSLMTGLTPAAHGINPSTDKTRGYVNPGERVTVRGSGRELMLAEALAQAGYRTAAITENAWVLGRFGFDQGFRYYRNANVFGLPATRDAVVADIKQFATRGPWMLFLHTYTTHQPYHAPKEFRLRYANPAHIGFAWPTARVPVADYRRLHHPVFPAAPSDAMAFKDLYDGQVAYVDTLVAAVMEALREKGVLDNTIVVVTSDHGEELFERGGFDHGDTMYEEATHVPLIVRAPGRVPAGQVVAATISLTDVAATILDLTGIATSHGAGHSLKPLWTGPAAQRVAFAESIGRESDALAACWDGTMKYIRRETSHGRLEWLFDLLSDPGEQRNLVSSRAADLARLRGLYDTHAKQAEAVRVTLGASTDALTEEDLERLRSLGYVQ